MPCQYFIRKHQIYLITEANSITTGAKVSFHFVTMKLNNLAFYFKLFCREEGEKIYTIYADTLRLILLRVLFDCK